MSTYWDDDEPSSESAMELIESMERSKQFWEDSQRPRKSSCGTDEGGECTFTSLRRTKSHTNVTAITATTIWSHMGRREMSKLRQMAEILETHGRIEMSKVWENVTYIVGNVMGYSMVADTLKLINADSHEAASVLARELISLHGQRLDDSSRDSLYLSDESYSSIKPTPRPGIESEPADCFIDQDWSIHCHPPRHPSPQAVIPNMSRESEDEKRTLEILASKKSVFSIPEEQTPVVDPVSDIHEGAPEQSSSQAQDCQTIDQYLSQKMSREPEKTMPETKYSKWKEDIMNKAKALGLEESFRGVPHISERSSLAMLDRQIKGKLKKLEMQQRATKLLASKPAVKKKPAGISNTSIHETKRKRLGNHSCTDMKIEPGVKSSISENASCRFRDGTCSGTGLLKSTIQFMEVRLNAELRRASHTEVSPNISEEIGYVTRYRDESCEDGATDSLSEQHVVSNFDHGSFEEIPAHSNPVITTRSDVTAEFDRPKAKRFKTDDSVENISAPRIPPISPGRGNRHDVRNAAVQKNTAVRSEVKPDKRLERTGTKKKNSDGNKTRRVLKKPRRRDCKPDAKAPKEQVDSIVKGDECKQPGTDDKKDAADGGNVEGVEVENAWKVSAASGDTQVTPSSLDSLRVNTSRDSFARPAPNFQSGDVLEGVPNSHTDSTRIKDSEGDTQALPKSPSFTTFKSSHPFDSEWDSGYVPVESSD